jgi:CrcB protein
LDEIPPDAAPRGMRADDLQIQQVSLLGGWMTLFAIALGGAVGSVSRYVFGAFVQRAFHAAFPFGTLAVNVLGCLLVGVLTRHFLNTQTHLQLRAGLIVGLCGGFTTFSTFGIETVGLIQGGEWTKAASYVMLSVFACLAATGAGYAVAHQLSN